MKTVVFHKWWIIPVVAVLLAGGCSKSETSTETEGYGTLQIRLEPDAMISTRAEIATSPVPPAEEFSLTISGTDYSHSWPSITAFNDSQTRLKTGIYTVEIAYGEPAAEGVGKPYYYGSKSVEILARKAIEESLTARIANAQVLVTATETFLDYFHEATFTVTTSAGNRFTFTPGSETADEAVFVQAGTRLTLSGEAKLQSQTGTAFDRVYTFPEQTLEQTVARTRHTFRFDAKDNGSATLTINLNDEFLDERTIDVELNEDSQKDNNA